MAGILNYPVPLGNDLVVSEIYKYKSLVAINAAEGIHERKIVTGMLNISSLI